MMDTISPAAIITFNRFMDNSWELEWQYFKSINWVLITTYQSNRFSN